jgi:hypothetical protein
MKKVTERPDGTKETIEGTPEEISAWEEAERKRGERVSDVKEDGKKKGKRVLLSEEDMRRIVAEEIAKMPKGCSCTHWHFDHQKLEPVSVPSPIWIGDPVIPNPQPLPWQSPFWYSWQIDDKFTLQSGDSNPTVGGGITAPATTKIVY